jgi:hypothetical protein
VKLWRVTIDVPPDPQSRRGRRGERKGWQYVFAVLADNKVNAELRALEYHWPDPDDQAKGGSPGTLVRAEEDEDGIMRAGTSRT